MNRDELTHAINEEICAIYKEIDDLEERARNLRDHVRLGEQVLEMVKEGGAVNTASLAIFKGGLVSELSDDVETFNPYEDTNEN